MGARVAGVRLRRGYLQTEKDAGRCLPGEAGRWSDGSVEGWQTGMRSVLVLNGPNLNLLGQRQPEIYGATTLAEVEASCVALGREFGLDVACLQSNHEGALVDAVQAARGVRDGIVINPGAYSHTSIAILDALHAFEGPVLEVHISNIHRREAFRHHSHVSARADGVVAGFGTEGYAAAIRRMATLLG